MKILRMIFPVLLAVVIFSGCETSKGVGEDMEKAGQEIQEAATDVQNNM